MPLGPNGILKLFPVSKLTRPMPFKFYFAAAASEVDSPHFLAREVHPGGV